MRLIITSIVFGIFLYVATNAGVSPHKSNNDNCLLCHSSVTHGTVKHFADNNDDCLFCHGTSQLGNDIIMTTVSGNSSCVACHVEHNIGIESGKHANSDCIDCHSPHSSFNKKLFARSEYTLLQEPAMVILILVYRTQLVRK